jgi:hypothetical protein
VKKDVWQDILAKMGGDEAGCDDKEEEMKERRARERAQCPNVNLDKLALITKIENRRFNAASDETIGLYLGVYLITTFTLWMKKIIHCHLTMCRLYLLETETP